MEALLEAMRSCEQTPGMTILQHGEMVRDYYQDLITDRSRFEWREPSWLGAALQKQLPSPTTMAQYHVFHDCGKPLCRTASGNFPDHAAVSRRVWEDAGGDPEVAELIGMDMDIHLLKDEGVAKFAKRPQAAALLLTGLAEIHANAAMFGGLESTSFKIKWKHINKRGKALLTYLT